jgi:predicted HTH transcriptional regulator
MHESHRLELKSRLTDSLEKEVVAFLNSREGGEIYIGINDDGSICGVESADDVILNINNRIRSRISPSIICSGIPRILHSYSRDCFRFTENFIRMTFNSAVKSNRVIQQDELVDGLVERLVDGLVENQKRMVFLINENPTITIKELAEKLGISTTSIDKNLTKLKEKKIIKRVGGDFGGSWEIIQKLKL